MRHIAFAICLMILPSAASAQEVLSCAEIVEQYRAEENDTKPNIFRDWTPATAATHRYSAQFDLGDLVDAALDCGAQGEFLGFEYVHAWSTGPSMGNWTFGQSAFNAVGAAAFPDVEPSLVLELTDEAYAAAKQVPGEALGEAQRTVGNSFQYEVVLTKEGNGGSITYRIVKAPSL